MKAQRPWRLRAWRLILTFFCVYHGRARGGMSLFPSAVQAGTLNTIEDLRQYYDIDDSAWSALPSMSSWDSQTYESSAPSRPRRSWKTSC